MKVRICSYNVLSSHLSPVDRFSYCVPAACDPELRFPKILDKLQVKVQDQHIICLQEVSMIWCSRLLTYFNQNQYTFIYSLYGKQHNGYMGVGIAFPDNLYKLSDCSIMKVKNGKKWEKLGSSWFSLKRILDWILSKLGGYKIHEEAEDDYSVAKIRDNDQVALKLTSKTSNEKFVVATYHMPCLFNRPKVMMIHAALSCQLAQNFARDLPLIWCGDMNFTPDSLMYKMITTGHADKDHPDHPESILPEDDVWKPELSYPMTSTYASLGGEPEFTNYAQTCKDEKPFVGVLDYIFLSRHWKPKSVTKLPNKQSFLTPLPTEEEPSDHVLIGAELEL